MYTSTAQYHLLNSCDVSMITTHASDQLVLHNINMSILLPAAPASKASSSSGYHQVNQVNAMLCNMAIYLQYALIISGNHYIWHMWH